ncbi:MAG: radical SAM family heme chaperone HemW [Pseudomonadota bacterium]
MIDDAGGFGVYVHWPYCARICPYCDFNVRKQTEIDEAAWAEAFARDLAWQRRRTGPVRAGSVYFGGGTPSLAPPSLIARIIDEADRLWGFDDAPEITLEANPNDIDAVALATWRAAGVNRLSIGVQSFADDALAFLGRDHDGAAARRAVGLALADMPKSSFDLIYALPRQCPADWRAALADALALEPRHLSLYQLTIEAGTAFARQVDARRWRPPDDDATADLYDVAQQVCGEAGLPAYEVSNHAGDADQSKHNLVYWRFGQYAGVGPGAHGRFHSDGRRIAVEAERDPARWLARVATTGSGAASEEVLLREAAEAEFLTFGLRLSEGVLLSRWRAVAERAPPHTEIEALTSDGLLIREGDRLRATADGRQVLNSLTTALLLADRDAPAKA